MKSVVIPYGHVDECWPWASEYLGRALKHSPIPMTIDDIREKIRKKEYALWTVLNEDQNNRPVAVYTTRIGQGDKERTLYVDWLGGEIWTMNSWIDCVSNSLREYGRTTGCDAADLRGRIGWSRILKSRGLVPSYVSFRTKL